MLTTHTNKRKKEKEKSEVQRFYRVVLAGAKYECLKHTRRSDICMNLVTQLSIVK